jgi:dihydrofolate reductase
MRKLTVFNFMSLDGHYADPSGDTSWHAHDPSDEVGQAGNAFAVERLRSRSTLLLGRVTYQLMASFWPTPAAKQLLPDLAAGMNESPKIVFSRTLEKADWQNTILMKEDVVESTRRLKRTHGTDLAVLGSASLLRQLAEADLIDEYDLMVDPVLLGAGPSIFDGLTRSHPLKLKTTRVLPGGSVLLAYVPA